MCGICGCSDDMHITHHQHDGEHNHHHDSRHISIEEDIFQKNNEFASQNRQYFEKHNIFATNIMSSPGSGKTTLLSKTINSLNNMTDITVIVGDQATHEDADTIEAHGGCALQINTGKTCHLDAHMISHAIETLTLKQNSVLFIENIGNLVCPALFNLGEKYKIVILSVTEGDNKPIKYPEMFRHADLLLITKMDLLPYVDFDLEKCSEYARRINPAIQIVSVSSKTGDGLEKWYQWLKEKKDDKQ